MSAAFLTVLVGLPLFGTALTVLIRHRVLNVVALLGIPLINAAAAVYMLIATIDGSVYAENVGAYEGGLAIPFVVDAFAALMVLVTSLAAVVCCWFLVVTGEDQYRFLPSLVLMMMAGVTGAFLTGDLFNFFVMVEVMVLPSYALIAVTGTWKRLGIGRMFVMVNLLTSTLLVMGVGFVYAALGTVNIAVLAQMGMNGDITAQGGLGLAIVVTALGIKSGFVPVHGWLVRSYPDTSAGMMALFSALHTKVGLYGIYRIYTVAYGSANSWQIPLAIVAVVTILTATLSAWGINRMRNVLAFMMTDGVGHILIGASLLTVASLSAGMFYMVHHIITMAGLLLLTGAIEQTYGTGAFRRLSGLAFRDRWTAVFYVLGLLSLVGLPPTSGLWGKLGIVRSAAENPAPLGFVFIGVIVLGACITVLALQRMWRNTFWGGAMSSYRPDSSSTGRAALTDLPADVRIPSKLLAPGASLIAVSVALFVGAGALAEVTNSAAESMLDYTPYIEAVLGR